MDRSHGKQIEMLAFVTIGSYFYTFDDETNRSIWRQGWHVVLAHFQIDSFEVLRASGGECGFTKSGSARYAS
jgi:hypothetical protein